MKKRKLALLNLYNGLENQGIRAIYDILAGYDSEIEITEFDVRQKAEVPGLEYDLYISSGGPGNPLEGDGVWDVKWQNFVQSVWDFNLEETNPSRKKHIFFICHSFQMACNYFGLGEITQRVVPSFGVYPCHKTAAGKRDALLEGLDDPYYILDSRDWQLIQPNLKVFREKGATILSLEKIRTHVEYERAIMAVRFSPEMVGTQYHPEADPVGMKVHFGKEKNRETILKNHSQRKYNNMMKFLENPEQVERTHKTVIPAFLDHALQKLNNSQPVALHE